MASTHAAIPNDACGRLPLSFEENKGQSDPEVKFLSRGRGVSLFLTATEAVLALHPGPDGVFSTSIRMKLVGANPEPCVSGAEEQRGRSSYFIGNDPDEWRTGIPRFARVRYESVYPGVDLVYYGSDQGQLEFDFVVAPGADPRSILLSFEGADRLRLDETGDLVMSTRGGELRQHRPLVYQERGGERRTVAGRYVLAAGNLVSFQIGPFDADTPLVIDPILSYSTFLGGSEVDSSRGIALDTAGNIYILGTTNSLDYPTLTAYQDTYAGGMWDLFVTKLDPTGSAILYSTYIGGSRVDRAHGIAVDALGNAYVTGDTLSPDYPVRNAFQSTISSGPEDAVVTKLSPAGSALVYSTYLGGGRVDIGNDIAVNTIGEAYVTGMTSSTDFPTASPLQPANAGDEDAFVTKLDRTGSFLRYSTYFGGSGSDFASGIAVDASGSAYLTGATTSPDFPIRNPFQAAHGGSFQDAFVTKLDPLGANLVYSTYLGGSGNEQGDRIAIDQTLTSYVVGSTRSVDFPTQSPSQAVFGGDQDVFVSSLVADGSALGFSTFLGGSGNDSGASVTVGATGLVYVTGVTGSTDFPTVYPFQPVLGGTLDAFVSEFDPSRSELSCSSYLGGTDGEAGWAIAVDTTGLVYVSGQTGSMDFPAVSPLQPAYGGGILDAFFSVIQPCLAAPDQVGDTLMVVRSGTDLVFTWIDVAEAAAYLLYEDTTKAGPFTTLTATATGGVPGITLPMPAEPRLFFNVVGGNCCGESPR